MLGDGHLRKCGLFIFTQSLAVHKEYFFYVYTVYFNLVWSVYLSKNNGVLSIKNTFCQQETKKWYQAFKQPNKRVKILPYDLQISLNYISLISWIADDGYRTDRGGIVLSTHNFSRIEVEMLINLLEQKFSLDSIIRKARKKDEYLRENLNQELYYYLIYLTKDSSLLLREIIQDNFPKSLSYKINTALRVDDCKIHNNYLPENSYISFRTISVKTTFNRILDKYYCAICDKQIKNDANHGIQYHLHDFECQVCGVFFSENTNKINHQLNNKSCNLFEKFQCKFCFCSFFTKANLGRHQNSEHLVIYPIFLLLK
jgi:hypothetical protein